jgi:YVTN family beta-propeller protein
MQTALPELSSASRAVVSALGCFNGVAPSAKEMAAWVGLRDRYQLARTLRRDGLPPLEQLAGWTRVLYWMLEAEASGASLRQLAKRERVDPAVAYRLVQRVTGLPWSKAHRAGLSVALLRLGERRGIRIIPARAPSVELARRLAQAVGDDVVSPTSRAAPPSPPRPSRPQTHLSGPPHHPAAVLEDRLVVGGGPFDVALTPTGSVLVTRVQAATVDVLRLQPLGHLGSVRTGPAPSRVIPDLVGDCAYVTSQFGEEIGILDLRTRRQSGTIPVHGHPLGAALAPNGRTLYITTNLDRLCAVSLPGARVVASVPIPMTCPHVAVHPSGHRVYVPCWKAGVIVEVDAHTLCPLRRFEVGGIAQDLVVTQDGITLYCTNEGGWLNAIHLPTGRVSTLVLGAAGMGLALSPDGQLLFASLVFAGRVAVIDTNTLAVRTTITTGGKPRLIAFERSGRTAVVANEAGWVDLIR